MRKILGLLIGLAVGVNALNAATYYVSATGNDANSGSISAPFATIQKAVDVSTSGNDLIYLRAGTYNQGTFITGKTGITITAYPGETAILDGTGATYSEFFFIAHTANLTISSLTMRNLGRSFARAIYVYEDVLPASANLTFSNNIFNQINSSTTKYATRYSTNRNSGSNAILVAGAINDPSQAITDVTITGNSVTQCEVGFSEAITVKGNVNGFLVADNTVQDISNIGIDAVGLLTWPALSNVECTARNGVIRNNTAVNCVNSYSDNGAIYVDGGHTINILYNKVYNNKYGINVGVENQMGDPNGNTYNIEVRDNLIYNNKLAGLLMGTSGSGTLGGLVTNCKVLGNTFLKNGLSSSHEIFLQYLNNVTFLNNIFYLKVRSKNLGYLSDGIGSGLVFDYNLYFNGDPKVTIFYMNGEPLSYYGNAHSIYADPMLTDASSTSPNVRLLSGSPAINAGDPAFAALSGETDFYGSTRIQSGRVDIGAAESGAPETLQTTDEALVLTAFSENSVSVYPNPASEALDINLGATPGLAKINIIRPDGLSIYNEQTYDLVKRIDVADLKKNKLILLRVMKNGHVSNFKIVLK